MSERKISLRGVRRFRTTPDTKFHIDYDWWEKNERNWRVYLLSYLCDEHKRLFSRQDQEQMVDFVDPQTAEVQRVDGVQHALISHCANQPDFITSKTALVDAVFRVFLANGNIPLNCIELSERLDKPAETILKVISGVRVYKGLRPILE